MRRRPPARCVLAGSVGLILALLAGCAGTKAGTRGGSVPLSGSSRAFGDLELVVGAKNLGSLPIEVTVELSRREGWTNRNAECFVATDDLRVSVDGERLQLVRSGGRAKPIQLSGVEMQVSRCNGAVFVSRPDARLDDRETTRVVIEGGGRRAEARIKHLLARRQARIEPSSVVRPGDRVTLVWTPAEDEWSGSHLSTCVHLAFPGEFSVSLEGSALEVDPPRFGFVVPDVRPGAARITLSTVYLEPHPNVLACAGLSRCSAATSGRTVDVDVTIAPR